LRSNAGLSALRLKLSLLGYLSRREAASECLQRLPPTLSARSHSVRPFRHQHFMLSDLWPVALGGG